MQNLYFIHRLNLRPRHICIAIIHYLQRMKIVKFQMYRKKFGESVNQRRVKKSSARGESQISN